MSSVNKNLILPDGHKARWYLSIPEETVIFSRTVNMATITYPVTSITYDGAGTGVIGDVLPDEEIIIFDQATAVEKGRLRVRGTGHTGSVLNVGEFSAGQLQLADNDTFAVLRSWRIRPRLPEASETFDPDLVTYTTQHSDPAPVVSSGGHYANWVSKSSATSWLGSNSFNVDPDSATSLTHSWVFPSGSPGSSASADPTIDYSGAAAGSYWVSHEATDTSNSVANTQYTAVVLHDDDHPPIDVLSLQWNSTPGDSSRVTITVATEADFASVPDGSLMMLWVDETFGATTASYGNDIAGRSHMKFTGYFVRDSLQQSYNSFTATFEAVSARGILEQLPGFSTVLTNDSTPTSWLEAKTLNLKQGIVYRLRELTTALTSTDLILPAGLPEYSELFIQQLTPFGQIQELADAVDCLFVCSRSGILQVAKPLYYESSANRTAATTVITLDTNDILDITTDHPQRYGFNLVEGRGFTAGTGGNAAAFSRAPGNAPSEAPQQTIVERLIFANQTELNQRTGRRYARLNTTNYGLPTHRYSITLRGNYDVFDAAYVQQWVNVDAVRCTIEGVSLSVDSSNFSEATVTLDLAEETDGVPGVTYSPPIGETAFIDTPPIDVLQTPPPTLPFPNLPPGYQSVPTQVWAVNRAGEVAFATAIDTTAHAFDWQQSVTSGLSGTPMWGLSDPYHYSRKYILTDSGLYTTTNVITTSSTWSLVANNATIYGDAARIGHKMIMSINRQGWMMIASGTNMVAYSSNYGVSWTQTAVDGLADNWGTSNSPNYVSMDIAISSRNSNTEGWVYATNGHVYLETWRSTNYGASWALRGTNGHGQNGAARIHVPHTRIGGAPNTNDGSQLIYMQTSGGSGRTRFLRSTDGGAAYTVLVSSGTGAGNNWFMSAPAMNPLTAFTDDGGYVFSVGSTSHVSVPFNVSRSEDGFDNYTRYSHSGSHFQVLANVNGWPYQRDWAIMWSPGVSTYDTTSGFIAYTDDAGVSVYYVTPSFFTVPYTVYVEFDLASVQ